MMVTGLAEGAGLLILVLAILDRSFAVRWPALALAVLLVARTVAWRGYRRRLQAPAAALAALAALLATGYLY